VKENAAKMHECCEIFSLSFEAEHRKNCSMECLAGRSNICCFDECFADRSGIFRNKFFNAEALIDSITRGRSIDLEEIAIVESSIKYCFKILNNTLNFSVCNIPEAYFRLIQCVLKENYKNCPNVLKDPECRTLGRVLESCIPVTTLKPTKKVKATVIITEAPTKIVKTTATIAKQAATTIPITILSTTSLPATTVQTTTIRATISKRPKKSTIRTETKNNGKASLS
jgi:hypothetical protein